MEKIKVLHLPVMNQSGGITSYVLSRFHHINLKKFQIDLLTFGGVLDFQQDVEAMGGRVHYISSRVEEDKEKFSKEMRLLLEKEQYHSIHIHTSYWKGFSLEELALQENIPQIIVHSHSTEIDIIDPIKRKEAQKTHEILKEKFHTGLATHFCACSHKAADWLFSTQIPKEKIQILNNAIDTEKFQFSQEAREIYRKDLNLNGKFVLGHIGRFVYQKNHHFLLEVFHKVSEKIPESLLLLVGVGVLEEEIKSLVHEKGLDEKVIFLGAREDVPAILSAMDLFLLPSRFEGFPISLVEAYCSGLPSVVSQQITDEVSDIATLLPLEETLWVEKIQALYNNPAKRRSHHEILEEKGFSLEKEIKVLEKLYEEGRKKDE